MPRMRRIRTAGRGRALAAALLLAMLAQQAQAGDGAQHLLERYRAEARAESPDFRGFSAADGRSFYVQKHAVPVIGEIGCVSCHLDDPRRSVMRHRTRIPCRACHVIDDAEHPDPTHAKKREIEAFAPVANPRRFSDPVLVEKWFELNCNYLLKRPCSALEKGNLITWLLSLPPGVMDNKPELGKEYDWLLVE